MDVPYFTQSFPEKHVFILFPGFHFVFCFATANNAAINILLYWGHFFPAG